MSGLTIDANLVMQELLDLKKAVAELQGAGGSEDITIWKKDISDRLDTAEAVIKTLNGSAPDILFTDTDLPMTVIHKLGTLTPFVTVYCGDELAYYQVRVIDKDTIIIDAPSGFIGAGRLAVKK